MSCTPEQSAVREKVWRASQTQEGITLTADEVGWLWESIFASAVEEAKLRDRYELSENEVELLCSALDSHRYWQLSEPQYRNSGDIIEPGTDDEDDAEEIKAADALEDKLRAHLKAVKN